LSANHREALLSCTYAEIYREAADGGFAVRTFIVAAASAKGAKATVDFCEPVPIFAVNCTIARMDLR
jgi:2,3-dihydroxyphenylpropionate 1,2-dioxygenase